MGYSASDLADWWDKQKDESNEILEEFVQDNPGWFSIGLATGVSTAMELGAGMVDALRLGKGMAEGTAMGAAQDVLRFAALVGPVARVVKFAGSGAMGVLSRVLVDASPGSGICTWVNTASALRRVGISFATVEDLAGMFPELKQLVRSYSQLPELWGKKMVTVLQKLGAEVSSSPVRSMADVVKAVNKTSNPNSVVIFSVEWNFPGRGQVGHALYAFRDFLGRVRIADRSGKVVGSLKELESIYSNIGSATFYASDSLYVVSGARMLVPPGSGLATLALAVSKMIGINTDNVAVEQMKKAFENYKATKTNTGSPAPGSNKIYTVVTGDSLSKIAKQCYNDFFLWPLIYDENKSAVGSNPNLIRPGLKLTVPDLKKFSPAQIEDARKRGKIY